MVKVTRGTRPGDRRRQHRRDRAEVSLEFSLSGRQSALCPNSRIVPKHHFRWAEMVSKEEWMAYQRAMDAMHQAKIPFLLGGGFALATFTGWWRDTKDIDFYVMPGARSAAITALKRAGFSDYYKVRPYDRRWIYRSVRSGVIVDIIWSMANQRAKVDRRWFEKAQSVLIRGEELKVVPMEEFIWCKLYILQRDHCDWTDIFNLIYSCGDQVDWKHLIERLDTDVSLLKAVLTVYEWVCPGRASQLPASLWAKLAMPKPKVTSPAVLGKRVRFLDSRAWFAALQPRKMKLQV